MSIEIGLHEAKLAEYREISKHDLAEGMRMALDVGIILEEEFIRFWKRFE